MVWLGNGKLIHCQIADIKLDQHWLEIQQQINWDYNMDK